MTRSPLEGKTGILWPNQRQRRTLHIQKDVLPYALCWLMCPVPAALASIFQMDSISTSYQKQVWLTCARFALAGPCALE